MSFSKGRKNIDVEDILSIVNEGDILHHYLGITKIPCVINSPLRNDDKPSFGFYSRDGKHVYYHDFASGDRGGTFELLQKIWNLSFNKTLHKIYNDIVNKVDKVNVEYAKNKGSHIKIAKDPAQIQVKIRDWEDHDIAYWKSFGITLDWLKMAEVYPISHKFIIKDDKTYRFKADKYAYAYVERKEGRISIKVYQPYNKSGFKWSTSTDGSVISLWTKIPKEGETLCICSSLKDALCLWANTGIPSIALQGEGYNISDTALKELKKRFKKIFIIFDNDDPGIQDATKLSTLTGFTNIVLPQFKGGKDISDLYHSLNSKEQFKQIILSLFTNL